MGDGQSQTAGGRLLFCNPLVSPVFFAGTPIHHRSCPVHQQHSEIGIAPLRYAELASDGRALFVFEDESSAGLEQLRADDSKENDSGRQHLSESNFSAVVD